MADVYIDAAAGSGGTGTIGDPYDTWAAFVTGEAADLTGNGVMNVYIKGLQSTSGNASSGKEYTTAGFTQTASDYVHGQLWPGETLFSAGLMTDTTSGFLNIVNGGQHTQWTDLLFESRGTGNNVTLSCTTDVEARNCKIICGANVEGQAVVAVGTNGIIQHCWIEHHSTGGIGIRAWSTNTNPLIDSNTIIRKGTTTDVAIDPRSVTAILRNNVTYGSWTTECGTSLSSSSSNNAGELAVGSQPANYQTNYVDLTGDPFDDSGSDDYHPAASGQLDGAGLTVSGITTDIEGTTKAEPPSIGAYEVAAAGGGPKGALGQPLHGPFGGPIG